LTDQQQIAVPETLLKKRRSNDKTREEKLAKATEARKVCVNPFLLLFAPSSSTPFPFLFVNDAKLGRPFVSIG
jgi:hypothetical protein